MKPIVEASVVHQVRLSGGISRIELARRLEIAPSTIGIHVERLMQGGFLREGRRAATTSGRPPTILELNPDAGQFIGVDLDARDIRAISVDFAQSTLSRETRSIPPASTAAEVVEMLIELIEEVKLPARRLFGIGLAVPGTIDVARGVGLRYQHILEWKDVPLGETMENRFGVPVYLDNNIRSMAMAERWFGQGRDVNDYMCIGIRSGIGSGLILRGELYRGAGNIAGEIGGWPCIDPETGQTKTLEELASLPALLRKFASHGPAETPEDGFEVETLIQEVERGNAKAKSVVATAAKVLGRVIAQVHLLFNPERVIIAGPLSVLRDSFLTPLRKSIAENLPPQHDTQPAIFASQFDSFVGAFGAAACAVHAWQPD